jgi:Regulatory subunit of type II PKA R-subunit
MSSKYQPSYTIPEELPAVLKDFTREILRAQPANLFTFAANYFAHKQGKVAAANTQSSQLSKEQHENVRQVPNKYKAIVATAYGV